MSKSEHTEPADNRAAADWPVTLQKRANVRDIIADPGNGQPAMRGFDPKFSDIVDYIVKITHEIWEERGLGRLYEYYGTTMKLHTSSGTTFGRDKVIEASIQALAAFPDRRLYADEVIWGGNDRDGFYSSHRLVHEGHNWGHTSYGPPTNRRVSYRAIADCAVRENVIYEEWLVRDELSLVHQLGFDVFEMARTLAAVEAEKLPNLTVPGESERLQGQLPPKPAPPWDSRDFDVERFVRQSIHEIWNWRLLNKVVDYYVEGFVCDGPSDRSIYNRTGFTNYVLSLMSPFPDLAVQVDHFCALREDEHRYRTASRWTMTGTHTGPGIYGAPTGRQIRIMGVSHHYIENGQFVKETTLFDEFALLKQLLRPA